MMKTIRTYSQQLADPSFENPKDIVSWMGAVQAQDYTMSKWALGIRMSSPSVSKVNKALENGEILRTHILRPTWHYVAAEDIGWMIDLCRKRLKATCLSWSKGFGIDEPMLRKGYDVILKMLEGNNHLSKQEIYSQFTCPGVPVNEYYLSSLLTMTEIEGMVCSGIEKNKKHTYALLDERVPVKRTISKEEALALLARKYFISHSPASLKDFTWWSGLSVTEAKQAIASIEGELDVMDMDNEKIYIHTSWQGEYAINDMMHFLPPYDEYLISYKDRSHAISTEHQRKAYSNNGLFHPVIYYNGRIVGNWKKNNTKKGPVFDIIFFEQNIKVKRQILQQAERKYNKFLTE